MKFHDLLKNALSGDSIALEKLLLIHLPIAEKYSLFDGIKNEDCTQYILIRMFLEIPKFKYPS